jgi:hypothetical protein
MSNLGGTLAQTILGEKGQHAQTQLGAAGQYGGLMGNILSQALGAGGAQRGIESEQLGEGYQKWLGEQAYQNPWLSFISQIFGARPYAVGQQQKSSGFDFGFSKG